MSDITPMKRQYKEIKERHEDCLLFFRLGDFYEMFDSDAVTASRELDLTLTTRDKGIQNPEERTPMCGVPYHSAEAYIARLIQKGYKVAICEQTEDPAKAKGLVKRDVIRVITPGTVTESSMLEESRSNYICSVFLDSAGAAVCFCDVSTGEFFVCEYNENAEGHIINEIGRACPAEAVLSTGAAESAVLKDFFSARPDCLSQESPALFDYLSGASRVCEKFGSPGVDELGLGSHPASVCAAGGLLSYLSETQKCGLSHIRELQYIGAGEYMELDNLARKNLELTETMRSGEKKGSLLWALDKTRTAMGGRLLRSWVLRPLNMPGAIRRRLAAVQELYLNNVLRAELMLALKDVGDFQRLLGKAVYAQANGRDLLALANSCRPLPEISDKLFGAKSAIMRSVSELDSLQDIREMIIEAVCDEPPFSVRDGGIIRPGYNGELDGLREIRDNGTKFMTQLEIRERERTGIKKLKIGYNKVFGYYIDLPRSSQINPPDDYIRKQTLVSNERYFTQELKELENTLLTARDRIAELEYSLFSEIRERVAAEVARIQKTADDVALLDVICSLAEAAVKNNYVMPEVDMSGTVRISEGRHPVVELTQKDSRFVPNDVFLDTQNDRALIVTGPNMAGKSTYMRQTALIVLMAQMGSFVPAASATIGITDRVFVRIGASDDLAAGQSTFMVEMTELSQILRQATSKSLLILDEIGRGTSTYDGMAVARAVLEYCADKKRLGAKTMFATHYHELTEMEGRMQGVKNYNITAKKRGDSLIFLRKIVPGAADDSYGIEVAKLAGLPESVIKNAKRHLETLESGRAEPVVITRAAPESEQLSLMELAGNEVIERLKSINPDTLSPNEAMNLLYELRRKIEV